MSEKTEQIFDAFFVVFVNVRSFDLLKTPTFCKISCNIGTVFRLCARKKRAEGSPLQLSSPLLFRFFLPRQLCVAVQQHR